jgi:hypothetical protein
MIVCQFASQQHSASAVPATAQEGALRLARQPHRAAARRIRPATCRAVAQCHVAVLRGELVDPAWARNVANSSRSSVGA